MSPRRRLLRRRAQRGRDCGQAERHGGCVLEEAAASGGLRRVVRARAHWGEVASGEPPRYTGSSRVVAQQRIASGAVEREKAVSYEASLSMQREGVGARGEVLLEGLEVLADLADLAVRVGKHLLADWAGVQDPR
jgi:hypothetical protein